MRASCKCWVTEGLVGRHRLPRLGAPMATPLPSGRGSGAGGRLALEAKASSPFDLGAEAGFALSPTVAQRPDHLVDAQDRRAAQPAGTSRTSRHRMVGCRTSGHFDVRRHARSRDLGFGRSACRPRKVQLSAGVGDSDDPDVGAQLPDMCDFACELRLQCGPCRSPARAEIEGLQKHRPWRRRKPPNRAAGGLAPGGLGTARGRRPEAAP